MESSSQPSDVSEQVSGVEEKPVDPMEIFSRQLEDIIDTYGSACSLLEEKISSLEKDEENREKESRDANMVVSSNPGAEQTASGLLEGLDKEVSLLLQSLKALMSPEEKVEMVLRKYAELLKEQKNEQVQMELLQKRQGLLVKQKDQLQLEHSRGILARSRLEILCRELHEHNKTLKEDMLQKSQEDERKRSEIHSHFQNTVVDIQAQIEQHSNRNNKLCQENTELAKKLTSILQKYEKREESLEKIFKQKDLQQQLSDAKLEEANLRLKDAEEKHKREKEYLLREAIDKTKKCFTMKEQELQMKKQLVLYSQKFDEFQATLAKSNEVYSVFKQEMDKMTKNMKKLEKESNLWKIRFESCNKTLNEMIAERSEKGKELELFTVKIDKLEMLCRALQEERKVLYEKIKEIRLQTALTSGPLMEITEEEIPELAISEPVRNPALTAEMEKLWKEQARLQEFAASLIASTAEDTSDTDVDSSEPQLAPLPPLPSKTIQLDFNQQEEKTPKEEPPKAEPPKGEPTKEEPPKAEEPSKVEPPKAEEPKEEPPKEQPPKVEPPKAEEPKKEPPKEQPPKAEKPKEEPPKEQPPKAEEPKEEPPKELPAKAEEPKEEPPKEQPPKAEEPKDEPPKEEPPKVEPPKAKEPKPEPPKEEPPKAEPSKAEAPKAKLTKVPNKNAAKGGTTQQNTHPNPKNHKKAKEPKEPKEPQAKEVKTVQAQAEVQQVNSSKHDLHPEPHPIGESSKEVLGAEAEPIKAEPEASSAGAAKPQNPKPSESKPGANKPQAKKPSNSKKKPAAKSAKRS